MTLCEAVAGRQQALAALSRTRASNRFAVRSAIVINDRRVTY